MNSSFLQALDKLLRKYKALEDENKSLKKELKAISKNRVLETKKTKKIENKIEKNTKTPSLF